MMKCWFALTLAAVVTGVASEGQKKPNIVVIYTDDHGYADLGCMGIKKDVKTPNIDLLAASGVRMTCGYVTAPQCQPSRFGLISGQYQTRFGVEANGAPDVLNRLRSATPLPARLKNAGYITGMAGKSHLGSDDSADLVTLGFDKAFFKHSNRPGHWNMDLSGKDIQPQVQKGGDYHLEMITGFACAFIERFKDQPFFFYLAYRGPHVPLDAPKKYLDRFPGPMPEYRRKALGSISAIDDGVGRVMQILRKNGLEENTLIFLISDNGAPLGMIPRDGNGKWDGSLNDPMNGEKGMLTEGGIRTPWVVRWKGTIPAGQVYANPVISLDVAATANSLAGLPNDPALDGINLLPYLTGRNPGTPHDALFWRWVGQFAIRRSDWKYLASGERQYLFDLSRDPEEKHNLLAQHPELAKDLRAQLEKWSQGLKPPGLVPTQMAKAGRRFYDFYLEGKHEAPDSPAEATSEKAQKRRSRAKRVANSEVAED